MENNNKPMRRVGTFTMGIYLVIVGILSICAIFNASFDFMFLLKLTPIVFVALGLEVLIYHFTLKSEKIKYDIFSIFICFVLIFATICTAAVPYLFEIYGPKRYEKIDEIKSEVISKCSSVLKENKNIMNIDASIYLDYPMTDYSKISADNADTYLKISLVPTIKTEKDFAAACHEILLLLRNTNCNFSEIRLVNNAEGLRISYDFSKDFVENLDVSMLEDMVISNKE